MPSTLVFAGPAVGADGRTTAPSSLTANPPQTRGSVRSLQLAEARTHPGTTRVSPAHAREATDHAHGVTVAVASASDVVALPQLAVVGVTWRAGSVTGASVQYRTETDRVWSDWTFLDLEADGPGGREADRAASGRGGAREGSAPVSTTDADQVQVRVIAPLGTAPADPELSIVDPNASVASSTTTASPTASTDTCPPQSPPPPTTPPASPIPRTAVPQPAINLRAAWGADETIRDPSEPEYGVVDAAFVHHTAGVNTYTMAEVPEIIRGIYQFHVEVRCWRDVGYNFFADKFGRIWEGRYGGIARAVVGAHAAGVNSRTFGVSVLGDYTTTQPTTSMMTALTNLIAWKADVHRFDVLGTTLISGVTYNNISGHRDANATECPGDVLYSRLPALRTAVAARSPLATRLSGTDRYATAAATSADTFEPGVPVAYVATGSDFPDALAGGPAGGHLGGPVLLTGRDTLPGATAAELRRLAPARIVVLGAPSVVSNAVATQLGSFSPRVDRLAGVDRFETAAAVSADTFAPKVSVAYVATGLNFPDALAAGPAGGFRDGPILLTRNDIIPEATTSELSRLAPESIIVLGSPGVVSTAIETQLRAYAPSVTRAGAVDRYGTAALTSAGAFAPGAPVAYIATGLDYPDALAGGPAGGFRGGPLLLTARDSIPPDTIAELTRLAPATVIVLGGPSVVSDAVARRLYNYEAAPTS